MKYLRILLLINLVLLFFSCGKLNLGDCNPYPIYDKKQEIMLLKNLK